MTQDEVAPMTGQEEATVESNSTPVVWRRNGTSLDALGGR